MAYLKYDGTTAAETPTATSSIYGSSAGGETLRGTGGAQALWGQGDGDTLIGGGGGDTFYLQGAGTRVQESASQTAPAQIVSWQNTYLADYANIQNLSVGGTNTYAAGNAQNNVIIGTGSGQEIYGGFGQDVLVGNGQSDTFIVVKGEGNDAIYNFSAANDVVRLNAGYKTFAEVQSHMSQAGADVKIDLGGGDGLVLRNMTVSQLKAANFQLNLDTSKLGATTFNDDFNTLSLWNGSSSGTWQTTILQSDPKGNGGTLSTNGEQQWYINSNYAGTSSVKPWTVDNGVLTLKAAPATADISAQINGYKYTSGMVSTAHSFAQTYGYFEMRADIPDNPGGWPAFWLMPTDGSWPPELDVMETLTSNPNYDYTTAHSSAGGAHTSAQGTAFIPDTSSGYHTYGVLWTSTTLTWYVDGAEVFKAATPADMNKPMYMIANLALGGWGGNIDPSQLPSEFKIDYMRAYSLADGSSKVTLDTSHSGGGSTSPDTGGGTTGGGSTTTPPTTGGGSTTTPPTTGGGTTTPPTTGGGTTTPPTTGGGTTTPPTTGGTAGQVLTATKAGAVLTGGTGADTFNASQGADTLTGGAGADSFAFGKEPWAPAHITDFKVGEDKLDLSALFKASGYTGSDPVKDKYIYFISDGSDGTLVRFDRDGAGNGQKWPNTIIDLEHVSSKGLTWAQLTGAAGGSTTTPPTTGGGSTTTPPTTGGGSTSPPIDGGSTTTPPTTGGTAGQVLTANKVGAVLTGGAGADTLNASQGSDTLTGGAGADRFVIGKQPWSPVHITDFHSGEDKLDLSGLFKSAGYTGSDPVKDHYITLENDGSGGTYVRFEATGQANINGHWPTTIIDIEHIAPSQVKMSDWIIH